MDKNDKVIQAAKLYYLLDCTQNEIAKKLGVSRPTVSRMLQTAKREGIVQIKICEKADRLTDLEADLEQKYGLKKAVVASVGQYEDHVIKTTIGLKAAEYLDSIVGDDDIIGVTWGTTIYHVAVELKKKQVNNVQVVQLKGGISLSEKNTYVSEILYLFGKAFNASPHYLPLPAIVDNVVVKEAIMADRHIKRVIDMGKRANIALFTCGQIKSDSLLFNLGYFSEEDAGMLYSTAVGDISSRFFDKDGHVCSQSLDERTLGIELEELKKKDYSILVAGGSHKIESIHAALKGEYANVLVTDQYTARFILDK
ncbi:RNA polymerase subunit sigma-70 [Pradoshia eiseniae]|uniref:RNA polymerase subunit sigma-70 n=1 Tax=Pradoshia eiseniae TaxID=2064768 RepID=A0A2S7N217_9BACI|nr:sugar-binding transcriptional regulator [Pradoshia eiseniae]PQD96025.1 RNA polymerase subunit sigma-70 [Pradoshia eiseniae]